ncbi:iron ABC transporter substrate-binding protein [Phreatobacter sp. AB_2022a]|uniref:iron ABC transporter substrate-binding protein n=1 Tax=Phreatobacter sp. AB_2022a TaxID=3003134 RepID=UPI0022872A0F|nr:iron ABC transporter substrate-binding protein [Phreatobacter sp. AB_2022a]MCZ0734592.1 iron ABC transporter substrate-binding protein [Phreatobacter sp. AB_2022a]
MITTTSGAKVYVGPTTPATDAAGYAALTYTEVHEVESIGEFGEQSAAATFTAIGSPIVRRVKGARDPGTLLLTLGRDALDPGQVALRAAEKTKFAYAVKIVAADRADANDTDTVFYFHAMVQSAKTTFADADKVTKQTFNLSIVSPIIEVPATVVP